MKNLPDLDPQNKYVAKIARLKRTATGGAVVGSVFGIAILAGLGFLTYKKVRNQILNLSRFTRFFSTKPVSL